MYVLKNFDPTASATAYDQKPKIVRVKQTATAKGENYAYGPTLYPIIWAWFSLGLKKSLSAYKRSFHIWKRNFTVDMRYDWQCNVLQYTITQVQYIYIMYVHNHE